MYCVKCGTNIENENAKFCVKCGTPVNNIGGYTVPAEEKKKSGSKKGIIVVLSLIILLVLIGVGGYFGYGKLVEYNEQRALQIEQEKREKYVAELNTWLDQNSQKIQNYVFTESNQAEYEKLVKTLNKKIDNDEDIDVLEQCKNDIDKFCEGQKQENATAIEGYYKNIDSYDKTFADENDLKAIEDYKSRVDSLVANNDYKQAIELAKEMDGFASNLGGVYDDYIVTVSQYDISNFPSVKVYLNVTDKNGNFINNLPSSAFYVNEGVNINGPFSRATITNVAQLNENEGISICLVADISGSMYYDMPQAKQAMNNFVNNVQFNKGDEIELTKFSEYAYICESFTNNKSDIIYAINDLSTGGSTRLYDTIITEIERVQSRSNAKCVIGFTDGYDNASVHSADDVINVAKGCNIPVFLIGIGSDCDNSTLRTIAESTGGQYQNITYVNDLENIYNSIYKEQKEQYLLEYTVSNADNFDDVRYSNIYIRTQDEIGGHYDGFKFNQRDFFDLMYNKFLIAGIDCQTKGERNLLDSGLIVTTPEAYNDPQGIAHQCQASIDGGGVGSNNSSTFEVLEYYDIINVQKNGDEYILYGVSNYDVSKIKKYSKIKNQKEKELISSMYGTEIYEEQEFWIEENISNYEKLTLVKDSDGKWKFKTRVYERIDGGDAVSINEVYNVNAQ